MKVALPFRIVIAAAFISCLVSLLTWAVNREAQTAAEWSDFRASSDAAWQELLSQEAPSSILENAGADRLRYVFAQYEYEAQQFRGLGKTYWSSFPDDPRRYDWLLLTTIIAPQYAADVADLHWHVDWQSYVPKSIDTRARDEWRTTFDLLKDEYLGSVDVPEEDKKLLLFAEARQALHLRHEILGEYVKRDDRLVETIEEIRLRYSDLEGQRSSEWLSFVQPLVGEIAGPILLGENPYGFSHSEQAALAAALLGLLDDAHPLSEWLNVMQEGGDASSTASLKIPVRAPSRSAWRSRLFETVGMVWPSFDRARQDHPARIALNVLRLKNSIWKTEVGLKLWSKETYISDQMVAWYAQIGTLRPRPEYRTHLIAGAGLNLFERIGHLDAELALDLKQVESEIASETSLSHEALKAFEFGKARKLRIDALQNFAQTGDSSLGLAYLEQMHKLHSRYGRGTDGNANLHDIIRASNLLDFYHDAGLTEAEVLAFLRRFESDEDPELREWSQSLSRLIQLRETPFEFETVTLEGEPFLLSDLRGQIIFVDFWATTCGYCIETMPRKHGLFMEHRESGLAVLSVAADLFEQEKRIRRLIDQHGLSWLILDGREVWADMTREFGLTGFPKYMILRPDGTMAPGGAPTELRTLDDVRTVIERELLHFEKS